MHVNTILNYYITSLINFQLKIEIFNLFICGLFPINARNPLFLRKNRNKSGYNDQSKKFIFNARNIDEKVTVGQLKLTEGSIIFVVSTSGIA